MTDEKTELTETKFEAIRRIVCEVNKIDILDLEANVRSRKREYVEVRQTIAYIMLTLCPNEFTLQTIADSLGYKNHATIVHCRTAISDRPFGDSEFRKKFETINGLCAMAISKYQKANMPKMLPVKIISENEVEINIGGEWVRYVKDNKMRVAV
jgi:hypothetical protein